MAKFVVPFLFCFALLACEFDVPITDDIPDRFRMMQVRDVDVPKPVSEMEVMTYVYIQMLLDHHGARYCSDPDFVENIINTHVSDRSEFDMDRYLEVEEAIADSPRLRNMMFRISRDMALAVD
jgi:hypothetical protein